MADNDGNTNNNGTSPRATTAAATTVVKMEVEVSSGRITGDVISRKPNLPIIIFPGFASSGLYVEKSTIAPGWTGKRLWINLRSLGIHSIHFGGGDVVLGAKNDTDKTNPNSSRRAAPRSC